jgi:hypothetical protein
VAKAKILQRSVDALSHRVVLRLEASLRAMPTDEERLLRVAQARILRGVVFCEVWQLVQAAEELLLLLSMNPGGHVNQFLLCWCAVLAVLFVLFCLKQAIGCDLGLYSSYINATTFSSSSPVVKALGLERLLEVVEAMVPLADHCFHKIFGFAFPWFGFPEEDQLMVAKFCRFAADVVTVVAAHNLSMGQWEQVESLVKTTNAWARIVRLRTVKFSRRGRRHHLSHALMGVHVVCYLLTFLVTERSFMYLALKFILYFITVASVISCLRQGNQVPPC